MTAVRTVFGRRLLAIALAGLVLRVAYVMLARRHAPVWGDSVSYHFGANLLADGKGFIDPLRYELAGIHTPSAYHPPLYMLYLAAWSVLGIDGPLTHRLVTCLLGAGVVIAVGFLGRRLAGDRAGLIAAAFAALFPYLWLNDGALLSESATALAVVLVLIAADRFRRDPSVWCAVQVGAAAALCALGRAELVLLLPFLVLPLVLTGGNLSSGRDRLVRLGAAAGAALVLLGPWVGYNLVRFDHPVTISNGLGATIAAGACDLAFHGELTGYWASCEIEQASVPPPDPAVAERWKADPAGTAPRAPGVLPALPRRRARRVGARHRRPRRGGRLHARARGPGPRRRRRARRTHLERVPPAPDRALRR